MEYLKIIAWTIIIIYLMVVVVLYTLQTRLIFYPGRLTANYQFKPGSGGKEVFLNTSDGEKINALFFRNSKADVILYFHGNAGDLSGWQFVSEDFTSAGYNFFI